MSTLKDRFALLSKMFPHISQADLARATGVKPPSVNDWFSGKTKTMKAGPAAKAAKLYGVSATWLATNDGPMFEETKGDKQTSSDQMMIRGTVNLSSGIALIPLLDRKTAGMHERYTTGGEEPPSTHAHPGQLEPGLFAYQVDDDLMEPIIQRGCIATISTRLTPRHGVCVLIQDGEDAYIRRLVVDGGAQLIESPRYPARPLPGRIIGVVHQVSTVFVNLGEEP